MKKLSLFFVVCIFTYSIFGQKSKSTTTYKGKDGAASILATKKIKIYTHNISSSCIEKCYIVYITKPSGKIIHTSFGENKDIGATTTSPYTFQVWLAEIDTLTGMKTGFESNTLKVTIDTGYNSFYIDLLEFSNTGQLQYRTTKPPSGQIIIGSGSPGRGE